MRTLSYRILNIAAIVTLTFISACSTRTQVSATGSTPPHYTHVYLTVNQVWLNGSATAQPNDGGWSKFTLTDPVTVDLVNTSNGTLTRLIGGLRLVPGNYSQIRLIPADTRATLTTSAKNLGASYNNEVDYVDTSVSSTGTSHSVPLEIPDSEQGIAAVGSLKVTLGGGAVPVASSATSSTPSLSAGTSGIGLGSNRTTDVYFTVNFNAATDIALFTYGSQPAAILNSHAQAFDLAKSGGISGTLTLTNLSNITHASTRLNISASAETLSADGTRHVVVLTAPVHSDGTFLLYPLPARDSTSNPTRYDVVIHGSGIQTIIVRGVEVKRSSFSSSSSSSTNATTVGTASVSIGTLIPQPAASYSVNITPTTLPAGSVVSLHQTLPGTDEVPYIIEHSVIDPFNGNFAVNLVASASNVQMTTYAAGGQALTLTSATPVEGTGSYSVAASATGYNDGPLNVSIAPPTNGNSVMVSPAALTVTSGASPVTATAQITQTSAGTYNRGQLIASRDGTIFATVSLDAALASATGGNVTVNLPGGSSSAAYSAGLYDSTVRVWNSVDPAGTVHIQSFPASIDARNGSVSNVSIAIN